MPSLWTVEIANALLVARRRRVIQEAQVVDCLQRLWHLPINSDNCSAQSRQEAVIALGRQLQLTAYDATYVELALRKGARLAAFDRRLGQAMQQVGGEIFH